MNDTFVSHVPLLGNTANLQVASANELALRQGFKPQEVAFVVGDAMAPALPDSSFDLVISVEAAAYMTDKRWESWPQRYWMDKLCSV